MAGVLLPVTSGGTESRSTSTASENNSALGPDCFDHAPEGGGAGGPLDYIVAVTRTVVTLSALSTDICRTVMMAIFPFAVLLQYVLPATGAIADTP